MTRDNLQLTLEQQQSLNQNLEQAILDNNAEGVRDAFQSGGTSG